MKDLTQETRVENPAEDKNGGWARARRAKEPFDAILYLVNKVGWLPDVLTMAKLMGLTQAEVYEFVTRLRKTHDSAPIQVIDRREGEKDRSIYIFQWTPKPPPAKSDKEIVQEHIDKLNSQDLRALAELLKGSA